MCGIAGKILFGTGRVTETDILLMTGEITHRGPDDSGIFISASGKVGLGNRRLAIIDLSENGHQPMCYKGRYWITTNSEIYNFQTEKNLLIKHGYRFDSSCDTEVILALYDKYREKCLDHLRGMFAFCIYDSKENKLFLARDRIGVKPLKYYVDSQQFIFASEAKAILTQSGYLKEIDYEALQAYLCYGYIPAPLTGFRNIKKLEPGSYITIDLNSNKVIKKRYWEPLFTTKLNLSENEWCNKILDTLEEATHLRMVSDVPIGAYLSGGVDSSAVVATMANFSAKPINTFTIRFKEKHWDESRFAMRIAKKYRTNHIELMATPADVTLLPKISYLFEEPFGDAGCVVNYMINGLAKGYVSVTLNGDGGDENFAGYPNRYLRLKRDVDFENWIKFLRPTAREAIKALNLLGDFTFTKRWLNFLEKSKLPLYEKFISYNQLFPVNEIFNLTKGLLAKRGNSEDIFGPLRKTFRLFKGKDPKDAGLKFDLLYWLPDDLLAKADLMAMGNSIEARSPFLDYKMIELTGKMPFNLKVKNGESKYILKKALEKIIPKECLYRPKRGFGLPLHKWFRGGLNSYARSILLSKKSLIKDFIHISNVKEMLEDTNSGHDNGPKLWSLLTMELWLKSYFS